MIRKRTRVNKRERERRIEHDETNIPEREREKDRT